MAVHPQQGASDCQLTHFVSGFPCWPLRAPLTQSLHLHDIFSRLHWKKVWASGAFTPQGTPHHHLLFLQQKDLESQEQVKGQSPLQLLDN